jgi:hypothetical protein
MEYQLTDQWAITIIEYFQKSKKKILNRNGIINIILSNSKGDKEAAKDKLKETFELLSDLGVLERVSRRFGTWRLMD